MKNIYLAIFLLMSVSVFAIKPTEIKLSQKGKIKNFYFNFEQSAPILAPLTAVNITGKLKIESFQLKILNQYIWFDKFGKMLSNQSYSNMKITYDFENRIEKIKDFNNNTLFKFYYDFNGRLEQVKDGNYNTKFKFNYDFDKRVTQISDGNLNKLVRFYTDFNNQVSGIKDKDFNYEYKFYYNTNNKLEKIKDANYNTLAIVKYVNGLVQFVEKNNLGCQIIVENNYSNNYYPNGNNTPNYGNGNMGNGNGNGNGNCNGNNFVSIYSDGHYSGNVKQLTYGNYNTLGYDWNNIISSIQLPPNTKVIVYEYENFGGSYMTITSSWTIVNWNDNWNDKISSMKIIQY